MNVITTTPAATASTTLAPQPQRTKRLVVGLVGAAVLFAGGITAVIVDQSNGPSTAPGRSPAVQQAAVTKADRLQADIDARTTSGDDVMAQIHAVTGVSAAAQQARTVLYHELRNG